MHHRWIILALVLLTACGGPSTDEPKALSVLAWGDVPGWGEESLLPALNTFRLTCPRLVKGAPQDWADACGAAESVATEEQAISWAETHFLPVKIDGGEALVTGYFEPTFPGSREPSDAFSAPILAKPNDLVAVDLGAFRDDLKGKRIAGRVVNGRLVPYEDRQALEDTPPDNADILGWMNADDLFFLQIQGSGVIDLDGEERRIGYAAQNGHAYHAIGKTLVQEGHIPLEEVTMQSIREWLSNASTEDAERVRHTNPSYVFFMDRGPAQSDEGPVGTANVPLTADISVAVDRLAYPLGAPLWITGSNDDIALRGLHIAQDTGGAIKGADRIDLFTGRGTAAGEIAGRLKLDAQVLLFMPRSQVERLTAPAS